MNRPVPKCVVLVRVGVDQTYGHWNAPCNSATGDFVYVPIPESKPNAAGMERTYRSIIVPALRSFSERNRVGRLSLPSELDVCRMHLDPDFDHLTYGDTERRGRILLRLNPGDWVVFYAGMRDVWDHGGLVYGLIGMLTVSTIRKADEVPADEYVRNAHTRRADRTGTDLIVTGDLAKSGRFTRYIDIGEFRNRSYRVKSELLDVWGGLSVLDGFLQRSANPPVCREPAWFCQWLTSRAPQLIPANNLVAEPETW